MSVYSMSVEQLHVELFEKMQEEQRVFVEELKTKTPDEILGQAYKYLMREDFLDEMEKINLSKRQIKALLASETPLADLYNKWTETDDPHMEDIKCTIKNYFADEADRLSIAERRKDRDGR